MARPTQAARDGKAKARGRNHFRQRDVQRLLRAYEAAGAPQPAIKVTRDGDLIAIPSEVDAAGKTATNPWAEVPTDAAHEKRPS